jgi:outer membrane lipoprotein SlyB
MNCNFTGPFQMKNKHIAILVAGAVTLIAATAGASVLVMNHDKADTPKSSHVAQKENIRWNDSPPAAQPQQVANCDDGNVVGAIAGGVGGGVLGSTVGDGKGKTAATIGGTLGGAYLGKEFIPTDNVTCRH